MLRALIDTCVWLDLAKDHRQAPLLAALEELVRVGAVSLIVPRIVVAEFRRNEGRIAKESVQSLRGILSRAKEAIEQFGDAASKDSIKKHLDDINQKMPIKGAAHSSLKRIGELLDASTIVETTEELILRAASRALDRRAPFHRGVNSMGDAIIIETYAAETRAQADGVTSVFVTHNKKDFSAPDDDERSPHPDLAPLFSSERSLYLTKLGDALHRAAPEIVDEAIFEHSFEEEPRGLAEILDAMALLFDQVWYSRHISLRLRIERGETILVDKETFPFRGHARRPVQRDVWQMALKAAERVENGRGVDNLGPWNDFEWGMINGKLSALRWVLGSEWDFLDT